MRVLVDTSVWVDFFNTFSSIEADTLERLIRDEVELLTCGVVVAELLQGIRRPKTLATVERHLLDMAWLTPHEPDSYLQAAALYRQLRGRGITIRSTIDCLIAQLAHEHGALLLSKDRDLRLIIESGILDLHPLPL